ncbi:hypothetical protein NDU88_007381 [Pleurodeles waltl]|uniref:Uncharacterized protein n=1 Tax=Pleurodeles waltl TaxID=8319 RepID=A0AAV7US43_PLEWA|nr:hypothetical protein NDU88_007381 [Pleurodeles waltl]
MFKTVISPSSANIRVTLRQWRWFLGLRHDSRGLPGIKRRRTPRAMVPGSPARFQGITGNKKKENAKEANDADEDD